jgi:cytochrome P450
MKRTVPDVPGHPLLGNLAEFRKDRIGLLTRLPQEYGDIARIRVGFFVSAVVVSAADLAHETLVSQNDAFVKSLGLSIFARPLLGDGLLTSEHELHRRQRRMIAPAFMNKRISGYAATMASYADRHVDRLRRMDGADLAQEMMQLTLEILGKTLFNADLSGDATNVREAVTLALQSLNEQVSSPFPVPPLFPSPANLRAKKIVRRLDDVIYRLIRERRATGADAGDLLSMLLLARDADDDSPMSDQQVRDEAMTIMLAGHETTGNALAWTFYLLARHPEIRQRLEDEVDHVLGGHVPTVDVLPRLPYALQVIKESMRLYPPAYIVVRRATRDVSIGPYAVRKGEAVILDVIGMHRRADYFSDPMRFDPDRFQPEAEKAAVKHAYLPFGGGPRVCIGNHFALMEAQIVLAHFAQHLRFDLAPGREDIETEPLITLRPRGGVPVLVRKRDRRAAGAIRASALPV